MAVLEVVVWPAKVLETRASEVSKFDDHLRSFVKDMHDTMKAANGIGLAANQVGDLRRVITIEIPWVPNDDADDSDDHCEPKEWWHDKKFTFVNPKITKKSGKFRYQEGCLSFPEVYEFIDRAADIWVTAQDENGKSFEVHATGLLSVCLQHEIDHIDGIVFIDRMSRLKAGLAKKKLKRPVTP
ncbi:MAG: peptide deformylase [Deltaproteobacteria bacterium]|nr:peptide deformylase [Deltaproteobacteria bacterium]